MSARAAVLFSGGKDSTLAALLLDPFYEVTLVTGHFGVTDDVAYARDAAAALDFPFERVTLDPEVAHDAADRVEADGYPREGIQMVHEHALETVAAPEHDDRGAQFDAVADGTRRDDRTPTVDRSTARSLEDRHGVDYVAPLRGFGHGAVAHLADVALDVERGPSERVGRADYEAELRAILRDRGADVDDLFPPHEQTRVTGIRRKSG